MDITWLLFNKLTVSLNCSAVYLTGGSARDELLGLEYNDFDFATGLSPDELCRRLDILGWKNDYSFIKYGVVKTFVNSQRLTVASMRQELNYRDFRHPAELKFVDDLTIDSKRRDFTVNAIYIDSKKNVSDPQNGMADLNSKVLRMIGDPEDRLYEDPLRILRAIRFKNKYNFVYDKKLLDAIYHNLGMLNKLNPLKVKEETGKFDDAAYLELNSFLKERANENH